jgi:hypothetical protein
VLLSYGRKIYQSFNHDNKLIMRRTKAYEISRHWSNDFQEGDDHTGIATTTATITVPKVQARRTVRFVHQLRRVAANEDKCTESSDVKHTYR